MRRRGDTAIRRMGEWPKGRKGDGLTEAQGWWGEAPALALIFAKSLAGFDDIVRGVDSLPSRGPKVMQRKCV